MSLKTTGVHFARHLKHNNIEDLHGAPRPAEPASSLGSKELFWRHQHLGPRGNEARLVAAQGLGHNLEVKDACSHHLLADKASTEDFLYGLAKLLDQNENSSIFKFSTFDQIKIICDPRD